MIVEQPKLVSETEFIMGGGSNKPQKRAVDITSAEDFPSLGGDQPNLAKAGSTSNKGWGKGELIME